MDNQAQRDTSELPDPGDPRDAPTRQVSVNLLHLDVSGRSVNEIIDGVREWFAAIGHPLVVVGLQPSDLLFSVASLLVESQAPASFVGRLSQLADALCRSGR